MNWMADLFCSMAGNIFFSKKALPWWIIAQSLPKRGDPSDRLPTLVGRQGVPYVKASMEECVRAKKPDMRFSFTALKRIPILDSSVVMQKYIHYLTAKFLGVFFQIKKGLAQFLWDNKSLVQVYHLTLQVSQAPVFTVHWTSNL